MRLKIFSAILALFLLIALFTNPTKDQYVHWAKEKAIDHSEKGLVGIVASLMLPTILDGTTSVSNFGVFSLYHTDIADEEIIVLGAFNNFVEIGKTKLNIETHNDKK